MIYRYLDCSTIHVTERDMRLLGCLGDGTFEQPQYGPIYSLPYAEGAFVACPDFVDLERARETEDACRGYGFSESFIKLLIYARLNECSLVRLDADGHDIKCSVLDRNEW